ncbi:MAG: hypothetical protein Q8904_14300 [Bacteroidota bacterium]|nr:hypothetical protein [Bacteroidota bacterium]
MINSKWGAYKTMGLLGYDIKPLSVSKISDGTDGNPLGTPIYQVNATDSKTFAANSVWKYDVSTSSTWGMMFGVKVSF